jgi:hypothetical protein
MDKKAVDNVEIHELSDSDLETAAGGDSYCCCSTTGGNCSNTTIGKGGEEVSDAPALT